MLTDLNELFCTGYVCSEHFLPEDYKTDFSAKMFGTAARRQLKNDAVPSVFVFNTSDGSTVSTGDEPDAKRARRSTSRSTVAAKKRERLQVRQGNLSFLCGLFFSDTSPIHHVHKFCFFIRTISVCFVSVFFFFFF